MPKPVKFPTKLLIGFDDRLLRSINDWRRQQEDLPPRTEAIRRLVQKGLEAPEARPRKK